jgi:hypothetical protein
MYDIVMAHPWLIPGALAMLIPILAIAFGTVTSYLEKTRQAELDAGLKHAMLERGMSAEEIQAVLEATSRQKGCWKKAVRQSADH